MFSLVLYSLLVCSKKCKESGTQVVHTDICAGKMSIHTKSKFKALGIYQAFKKTGNDILGNMKKHMYTGNTLLTLASYFKLGLQCAQ